MVDAECPGMVVFAGTQPPERMPEWWRAMDVGLVLLRSSPELATVIPSKMFEAMATARPILFAGPGGAGSAIVERHGAGVVVDDGQAESLATAARLLRDDAEARERMAAAALAASPSYSRERHARESLDALVSIVEGRRS
jgi:glycosyltransferase involved in cell wall biosynthesis